jgi:hypothetical protein
MDINDIPEKDKEVCFKFLKDMNNKGKDGVNTYGAIYGKDNSFNYYGNFVCYAMIRQTPKDKMPINYFLSTFNPRYNNSKDTEKFLNWLIYWSPFSKAFITIPNVSYYDTGMIMDVSHSPQYIVGALSVARECDEQSEKVKCWTWLVDNGMHPDVAYLISYYLRESREGWQVTNRCPYNSNHMALDVGRWWYKRIFKRWFDNKPILDDLIPMRECTNYNGIQVLFSGEKGFHWGGEQSNIKFPESKIKKPRNKYYDGPELNFFCDNNVNELVSFFNKFREEKMK